MKIDPKNGLAQLLFGMKTNDVVTQLSLPNRQFQDEDGNTIYLYDSVAIDSAYTKAIEKLRDYERTGFDK